MTTSRITVLSMSPPTPHAPRLRLPPGPQTAVTWALLQTLMLRWFVTDGPSNPARWPYLPLTVGKVGPREGTRARSGPYPSGLRACPSLNPRHPTCCLWTLSLHGSLMSLSTGSGHPWKHALWANPSSPHSTLRGGVAQPWSPGATSTPLTPGFGTLTFSMLQVHPPGWLPPPTPTPLGTDPLGSRASQVPPALGILP